MLESNHWRHIFKLDPEKEISDHALERLCESGSDAIIIGGTSGVTFDNVIELLSRVRRFAIPCLLEVSNHHSITPGFDHYLVPFVLNATEAEWMMKAHQLAVKEFGALIPWQNVSTVGYCVLNSDSTVAQVTKSETSLSSEDIIAYGRLAAHLLRMPFFYLEYSGRLADVEQIKAISLGINIHKQAQLIYGGGISSREEAIEMSLYADIIVVGNIIYDNLEQALETVLSRVED